MRLKGRPVNHDPFGLFGPHPKNRGMSNPYIVCAYVWGDRHRPEGVAAWELGTRKKPRLWTKYFWDRIHSHEGPATCWEGEKRTLYFVHGICLNEAYDTI